MSRALHRQSHQTSLIGSPFAKSDILSQRAFFKLNGLLALRPLFFVQLVFRTLKTSCWLLSKYVFDFIIATIVTQILSKITRSGFSVNVLVNRSCSAISKKRFFV
jgi:hypothetical protein